MPEIDISYDSEMPSPGTKQDAGNMFIDLNHYRKLVRSYIDMVCLANINVIKKKSNKKLYFSGAIKLLYFGQKK